jgi:hypothetical protein
VRREANNIRISWIADGGRTNIVQATNGGKGGTFTNKFTDLTPAIIVPGVAQVATNYLDLGGATNTPARYYRIRLVP